MRRPVYRLAVTGLVEVLAGGVRGHSGIWSKTSGVKTVALAAKAGAPYFPAASEAG